MRISLVARLAAVLPLFLLCICLAAPAAAQTIDLVSIDAARFGTTWTLNGTDMESARAKLLSTSNFGPAGTVGKAVAITDTAAAIDATVLLGAEVVVIGYLADDSVNAFTPEELEALEAWVEAGGGLLVTCDDDGYDAVCAHFGWPAGAEGGVVATASGAGWNHPALVGPFGPVRQVAGSEDSATFADPNAAATILRSDSTGLPIGLATTRGAGRVLFLGDVDMLSDFTLTPGSAIESPNDKLLGNAVAWLAGESGGACLPDATTLCIDDVPGDGRFRVRVRFETALGGGFEGDALATSLDGVGARTGGLFTFFNPAVPEMLIKVLNGCSETGHFWVYFSAGTNAGFTVKVEDLIGGGAPWTYTNPDLVAAPPVQDIEALPCP